MRRVGSNEWLGGRAQRVYAFGTEAGAGGIIGITGGLMAIKASHPALVAAPMKYLKFSSPDAARIAATHFSISTPLKN